MARLAVREFAAGLVLASALVATGASASGATPSASLELSTGMLPAAGGQVTITLTPHDASSCLVTASTAIGHLPWPMSCASQPLHRTVTVPQTSSRASRSIVFTAVVRGPEGAVTVRLALVQQGNPRAARWWVSPAHAEWQWELDHPLNLSSASDMGRGDSTYLGAPSPAPTIYDIDGFDNSPRTVAALHARGDHVICYIEVGAAESYRSDYREFPASSLGKALPGYPQERYLDINDASVRAVVEGRIRMCASKGFDAVEPDIDDSYTDPTGFSISEAQNVAYDIALADYAHSLGLAFGLKNGDSPSFARALLRHVDFVIDEQCFQYDTCSAFSPSYVARVKAVFEVEYSDGGGPPPSVYCPQAIADHFDTVELASALDGSVRVPCA